MEKNHRIGKCSSHVQLPEDIPNAVKKKKKKISFFWCPVEYWSTNLRFGGQLIGIPKIWWWIGKSDKLGRFRSFRVLKFDPCLIHARLQTLLQDDTPRLEHQNWMILLNHMGWYSEFWSWFHCSCSYPCEYGWSHWLPLKTQKIGRWWEWFVQ